MRAGPRLQLIGSFHLIYLMQLSARSTFYCGTVRPCQTYVTSLDVASLAQSKAGSKSPNHGNNIVARSSGYI